MNKRMYLGAVKFKTKNQKYLGTLLIFTSIPLVPKKCGLSISLYVCVQGRIRECPTLTYKPFHTSYKILYISLLIIDYLIGLTFWAISIELQLCGLEWDQKRTNKTLVPMGLGLFCQLLTSSKLPLIIINTII